MKHLFIAGFPKCGTSSLFDLLNSHSKIAGSRKKEPHYFINHKEVLSFCGPGDDVWHRMLVRDYKDYSELFEINRATTYKMEGSTNYLYCEDALKRIVSNDPGSKFIVLMRDPSERAYSAWMHLYAEGRENLPFEEALTVEMNRFQLNFDYLWRYVKSGNYPFWIKRLLEIVNRDNVLFINTRELKDIEKIKIKICNFLKLSVEDFKRNKNNQIRNKGGFVKNPFIHKLQISRHPSLKWLKSLVPEFLKKRLRRANYIEPTMSKETKIALDKQFYNIKDETFRLTGIKL